MEILLGEDADDPNSYNFKKMDWFHLDATRNFKEPIVKSELEHELTKARISGNVVKDFTTMVKSNSQNPTKNEIRYIPYMGSKQTHAF